jgi:uncharacterized protein YprB with RNaseH-like and TPR domain
VTTSSRLARLMEPASDGGTSTRGRLERSVRSRERRAQVDDATVAAEVGGVVAAPGVVVVELRLPLLDRHGAIPLSALTGVDERASLGVSGRDVPDLLFLDTETTGLAGGTGTLPFLLGLARVESQEVVVRQLMLTGFAGEGHLLELAGPWWDSGTHLVSYNGKSFDVPLLIARHRLRRLPCHLAQQHHVDLLHPTRAAFGRRWADCRLLTAETQLLGFTRPDDLPGALVPDVWTALVRRGDLADLERVLDHNRHDLLTLMALLPALSAVFDAPDEAARAGADPLAVARHHLRRGDEEAAVDHLVHAGTRLDPDGVLELARLHRRAGDLEEAVALWRELADQDVPLALEHLAKYHEHICHDPWTALDYTQRLADVVARPDREARSPDVGRRQRRLSVKVARVS